MRKNNAMIVVSLEKLIELFGQFGLPKEGDCAPVAQEIIEKLDELLVHTTVKSTLNLESEQVVWNPGDDPLVLLKSALRELSIEKEKRYTRNNTETSTIYRLMNLLYEAWGVIANAGGWDHNGKISKATTGWQESAERWRGQFHMELDRYAEEGQ